MKTMFKISFFLCLFLFITSVRAQELTPTDEMALVTFIVSDYDLIPEQGAIITVESQELKVNEKLEADIDGKARILLPEGGKFSLKVFKFGETFDFGVMEVPVTAGSLKLTNQLKIRIVEGYARNFTLDEVYFETGSYTLSENSMVALRKLLSALEFNPRMKLEIAGHTDNVGSPHSNLNLSQRRADAIIEWLEGKGVDRERLIAKGYGDSKPIADNSTETGRRKNRRTEVRIIEE